MKRIVKLATLLLSMIVLSFVSACSVFSNQPSNKDSGNRQEIKTQTITVYKDDTPTTYTITLGEVAEIDVFTKAGEYFIGAYDSIEGGTQYFDGNGQSTMVWGVGNPDTYYARFESIYNLTYSEMQYDEEPVGWKGTSMQYVSFTLSDEWKRAIAGNLDKTLNISVSCSLSCDRDWDFWKIGITNLKSGGENILLAENINLLEGAYKTLQLNTTMSARLVKSGELLVYLQGKYANVTTTKYYFKNISVSVSFVEE